MTRGGSGRGVERCRGSCALHLQQEDPVSPRISHQSKHPLILSFIQERVACSCCHCDVDKSENKLCICVATCQLVSTCCLGMSHCIGKEPSEILKGYSEKGQLTDSKFKESIISKCKIENISSCCTLNEQCCGSGGSVIGFVVL